LPVKSRVDTLGAFIKSFSEQSGDVTRYELDHAGVMNGAAHTAAK